MRAPALIAVVLATLLAACGGDSAGQGSDPARAVPARASIYLEAVIRPDGELRDDAQAALRELLRTDDPGQQLRTWINDAFAESEENLSWERDYAPWVGERVGLWVDPGAAGKEAAGALIMPADDEDAAKAAVERIAQQDRTRTGNHAGVSYSLDSDGEAVALVDGYVLEGDEAAFKQSIDVLKGKDSLAEADRYTSTLDRLTEGRLGHAFMDVRALMEASMRADPATWRQAGLLRTLIPEGPTGAAFVANAQRLALDMVGTASGSQATLFGGGAAPELVADLPGDSWMAYGVRDAGGSVRSMVRSMAGALGSALALREFRRQTGLDLDRDLMSWMGDAAIFVRGDGPAELDGGVVFTVTKRRRAARAVARIAGAVASKAEATVRPVRVEGADTAFFVRFPRGAPLFLAQSDDRVVLTAGPAAASAALEPPSRLAESEAYATAQSTIGMAPSMLLDVQQVLQLVKATGAEDRDYRKVKPYLRTLGVLAVGTQNQGGQARSQAAVTLR